MTQRYHVYIMSNISRMIYIGITNDLARRVEEHKSDRKNGFTGRYNIHRLIYYEEFQDVQKAIAREKELKGWRREKKIELIEKVNPEWKDLAKK
ncbi:MAG: GIY-YIG nuclease family protein [Balneolaceae bacterium]|nr:GIY-YIG nuclease family protein [Balneolaceae bacterium]